MMMQLAGLGFFWVIFHQTRTLNGWSGIEALFLFGLVGMSLGLSELLFNHIWMVPFYVVMGDLDRLITYPVHTLPFLLVSKPELHSFGNMLMGTAAVTVSLWMTHQPPHIWLSVPVWWLCGTLVYTATLVAGASLAFRILGPNSFMLMIPHNLLHATRYPISIYPVLFQWLLLVILPYGLCNYLPGSYVFGKAFGIGGALAAPLGAFLAMGLAHRCWLWGLKQYQSTGS
jgi:ABC-2 type transport system permease protein